MERSNERRKSLPGRLARLALRSGSQRSTAAPKQPVYVGARACGACHSGKGMGNQYGMWLHSKHSRAYAALARPESKQIAAISGLRQAPQEAPICLGCHATAYNSEEWEKDDTFHIEDGVQCEVCHGPGSEYMSEAVMRNKDEAMKAGLRMPDERFCMGCHIEKGTHVAVLKSPPVDIKKSRAILAHPAAQGGAGRGQASRVPRSGARRSKHEYVGPEACGACHKGEKFGHQYSLWRMGPHARAWSVLATPAAYEQAAKKGIKGDPQTAPECLKCHSTGYGGRHAASATVDDGVTCEACHGPGSDYMAEAIMHDRTGAKQAGLMPVSTTTCLQLSFERIRRGGGDEENRPPF